MFNPDPDIDKQLIKARLAQELFGVQSSYVTRGRFGLSRRLGRGAMGTVYEGLDLQRGERVAVKMLNRLEPAAIVRLKREFRSLSNLVHVNLVRLDELFHENDEWFFSMELIDGTPFDRFVREESHKLEAVLVPALAQLASAVEAIHCAGQLHRDLKPSNVLVTSEGRLVVLDFGLVCDESEAATRTQSEVIGTPAYMAPEQARSARATSASDWYAVGVMLFEALTGHLPFTGTAFEVLEQKQRVDGPDPRVFDAGLPAGLSELCVDLLRREPAERAGGVQVQDALARAGWTSAGARGLGTQLASPPSMTPAFVGRDIELAELEEMLARARSGMPAVALVHGASGIGKSALLDQFAQRQEATQLRGASCVVLRGRCHEKESVPYKLFDGPIDALVSHARGLSAAEQQRLIPRHFAALVQLFPALARLASDQTPVLRAAPLSDAREQRKLGFAALKEMLLRLTDQANVVIVVDDLQWGDLDSAYMLASLFGPPEPPPLLFVGAYREDEVDGNEFLRQIRAPGPSDTRWLPRHLPLGPLEHRHAIALVRTKLTPAIEDFDAACARIAAEAEGVPFFACELARYLSSDEDARSLLKERTISLEELIHHRLRALDSTARDVLELLSVAAAPLETRVASRAAGQTDAVWRTVLHLLRSARWIRLRAGASEDAIEIYHDRLRETIARTLLPDRRRALHAALAQAFERTGIDVPERLVLHYIGAGDHVLAGTKAVQAAQAAAQKLAFNRAVALYQQAVDLLPLPGQSEGLLYSQLGDALANAGRNAAAARAYLKASALSSGDFALKLRSRAARQYLGTSDVPAGLDLARGVFADLGVLWPASEVAMKGVGIWHLGRLVTGGLALHSREIVAPRVQQRLQMLREVLPGIIWVDALSGTLLSTDYLRRALDAGDLVHALAALVYNIVNLAFLGGPIGRAGLAQTVPLARSIAARVDTPYAHAFFKLGEAHCLLWSGRALREARLSAAKAREVFETEARETVFWERHAAQYVELYALQFTGNLREAATFIADAEREVFEHIGHFSQQMMLACGLQPELMKGDARGSLQRLQKIRASMYPQANFRLVWWHRMCEALIYDGQALAAHRLVEAEWTSFARSHLHAVHVARCIGRVLRARAAIAAYAQTRHSRLASLAWRVLRSLPTDDTIDAAWRAGLSGALLDLEGKTEQAGAELERSRALCAACQADLVGLYVARQLHELHDDLAGVTQAEAALRAQGIHDPHRLAWSFLPARWR